MTSATPKVPNVCAGDEQNERQRAEQDVHARALLAKQRFAQRLDADFRERERLGSSSRSRGSKRREIAPVPDRA